MKKLYCIRDGYSYNSSEKFCIRGNMYDIKWEGSSGTLEIVDELGRCHTMDKWFWERYFSKNPENKNRRI